jgi:hypothetical protein
MFPKLLLWLFVVNLGIVFGAGMYEARISVARWIGPSHAAGPGWHAEEARRDDTGRRFWAFTTTAPLTLLNHRQSVGRLAVLRPDPRVVVDRRRDRARGSDLHLLLLHPADDRPA